VSKDHLVPLDKLAAQVRWVLLACRGFEAREAELEPLETLDHLASKDRLDFEDRTATLDRWVPLVTLEVLAHLESGVIRVNPDSLDLLEHRDCLACLEVLEFVEVMASLVKPAGLEEQVCV